MIQDIVRSIIQRVMRDKILLGLVVIGFIAIFVTAGAPDAPDGPTEFKLTKEQIAQQQQAALQQAQQAQAPQQEQAAPQQQQAAAPQGQFPLDPTLATDFVKWWTSGALDYKADSAAKNHEEAFKWITPEAQETFKANYWNEQIAQGISTGQLVASFQPISYQAQAVNPDGSVVVSMKGTIVKNVNGQAAETSHVFTDFLVKKDAGGLRICAIYNRQMAQQQMQQPIPTAYY